VAKESSFDIVSEIDLQEVDNALNQARREAVTRYDLKSADCLIDWDKEKGELAFSAKDELSLSALVDLTLGKLIRRGIDVKALDLGEREAAGGGRSKQTGRLVQGIEKEVASNINKLLKQSKLKIGVQIQGAQVRVSGKNKDDLQEAIRVVKEKEFGIPLQFTNFR
jgi:cyclic-di-GMP-binding protein